MILQIARAARMIGLNESPSEKEGKFWAGGWIADCWWPQ